MKRGFARGVLIGLTLGVVATHTRAARRVELDALTGIPLRRTADQALASLRFGDAVVMVDLDELKAINDRLGHDAGDAVLTRVADHFTTCLRRGDTVARWGGDEFVLILRDSGAAAVDVVERLRQSSPARFSAGIAVCDGGPGAAVLAEADAALLAAKRAGRDRVVVR